MAQNPPHVLFQRILSTIGILGGVYWNILPFYPPMCVPITDESEVLCNRLWSPALFGMLLGSIGLFLVIRPSLKIHSKLCFVALITGFALMFSGNFSEYWILYKLPHQGSDGFIRGLAWITVLAGLMLVQVASIFVGVLESRTWCLPKWLSALFVFLFPATILTGWINLQWIGMPMGITSLATGFAGLVQSRPSLRQVISPTTSFTVKETIK